MNTDHKLNVLLIQYLPLHKQKEENIKTLTKLLSKYDKSHNLDLIIFPEMALTGYVFTDIMDIYPLLEEYNTGATYNFCSALAKRLNAYVFCGYPEVEKAKDKDNWEKYYNSAMIVDREGNALKSYRKSFLYETDKTWSEEGNGFLNMKIITKTGKEICLGVGICMDINPYEFQSDFKNMEFSTFCHKNKSDAIVFLTNWTESESDIMSDGTNTIQYWLSRCAPFLKSKKEVYFLASDRTGQEKGTDKNTFFVGNSCILKLCDKP